MQSYKSLFNKETSNLKTRLYSSGAIASQLIALAACLTSKKKFLKELCKKFEDHELEEGKKEDRKIKVKYPLFVKKNNKNNMFQKAMKEDFRNKKSNKNNYSQKRVGASEKVSARSSESNKMEIESRNRRARTRIRKRQTRSTRRVPEMDIEALKQFISERRKKVEEAYVERMPCLLPQNSTRFKFQLTNREGAEKKPLPEPAKTPISEKTQKDEKESQFGGDEDNLCYICFSDPPNCLFLECGHGGVCLNCAIDTMRNSNFCTLCRTEISQILEIDDKEVRKGIYKVLNSYYITKPEDDEDDKLRAN